MSLQFQMVSLLKWLDWLNWALFSSWCHQTQCKKAQFNGLLAGFKSCSSLIWSRTEPGRSFSFLCTALMLLLDTLHTRTVLPVTTVSYFLSYCKCQRHYWLKKDSELTANHWMGLIPHAEVSLNPKLLPVVRSAHVCVNERQTAKHFG